MTGAAGRQDSARQGIEATGLPRLLLQVLPVEVADVLLLGDDR